MPPDIAAIGVDNGGTWIRLKALNRAGQTVRSLKYASPPLKDLPVFIKRILRRWKTRPDDLAIGSKGVWSARERRKLQRKLRSLADRVTVMSDVETAWLAAFKDEGIIVIAGTGSIAYARDADGCTGRAGGLGPWIGDEGSAFWIGKQWLDRNGRPLSDVRHTAAKTRTVFQHALRGHRSAKTIIGDAQEHLATLVEDLSRRLHWKQPIPVSWSGSVLDNPWFRKGFLASVRRKKGRRFHFIQRTTDPATAVAHYVLNHARS